MFKGTGDFEHKCTLLDTQHLSLTSIPSSDLMPTYSVYSQLETEVYWIRLNAQDSVWFHVRRAESQVSDF
jgi:hypothetical protein